LDVGKSFGIGEYVDVDEDEDQFKQAGYSSRTEPLHSITHRALDPKIVELLRYSPSKALVMRPIFVHEY